MVDRYYSRPSTSQEHWGGPLEPYLDGFSDFLNLHGYAKYSGYLRIRLAADLSHWLKTQQLSLQHLHEQRTVDFLKARSKHHCPNSADKPTLLMLLSYLRHTTAIPPTVPLKDSPLDELLRNYTQFLERERGITPTTIHNYFKVIRGFLVKQYGQSAITLHKLCLKISMILFFLKPKRYALAVCNKQPALCVASLGIYIIRVN